MDSIAIPRRTRQGRILIADDDQAIVGLLERILARAGFSDVTVTTDSGSVVELYAELSPDLVILDLVMPSPDGFELMAKLAEIIPEDSFVPILVLTGNLSTETKRRALDERASDFLTKPFDVTEVLLRIRNLLATRLLHLETMAHNRILDATVKQRTQRLEEARLDVLARLARTAEFRDDETGEHTRRVGVLSAVLGGRLGMSGGYRYPLRGCIRRALPRPSVPGGVAAAPRRRADLRRPRDALRSRRRGCLLAVCESNEDSPSIARTSS